MDEVKNVGRTINVPFKDQFDPTGKTCSTPRDKSHFYKLEDGQDTWGHEDFCGHPARVRVMWGPGRFGGWLCGCCERKGLEASLERLKQRILELPHQIDNLPENCIDSV